MNSNNSQQNFRARVQAFENQDGAEGENASQPPQINLPPRRTSYKPPVATKPSFAFKSPSVDDFCLNTPAAQNNQNPFTSPRPQPAAKPGSQSIREELEALHSRGTTPHTSFPPVLTRSESIDEDVSPFPPVSSAKPFREPLKANLNINNHNSASRFMDNERVDSLISEYHSVGTMMLPLPSFIWVKVGFLLWDCCCLTLFVQCNTQYCNYMTIFFR